VKPVCDQISKPSLQQLFGARSVAIVGASERSTWFNSAYRNFEVLGFDGRVHLVNRRGAQVFGKAAARSCAAIGEPVDAALLLVPADAMADAFRDLQDAGIRNAVILTAGFAEAGGRARQNELLALARMAGLTLVGPNCLGFINFVDRIPIWSSQIRQPVRTGSIGLVSQSGATAVYVASFANEFGIGFSHIISTGNEVDVDSSRAARYLVDDPATKVIALFLEGVRDRDTLVETARLAREAVKPMVVLKVGASEAAAHAAQAHTGSLVGDERVFDAACRQLGIIRVHSIEDLVFTSELLVKTGPIRKRALGAIAVSGGVCEIAADRCAAQGVPLADLSQATRNRLRQILPDYATVTNPLDVTGAAIGNPLIYQNCAEACAAEPAAGLVTCFVDVAAESTSEIETILLNHIGKGLAEGPAQGLMVSVTPRRVNASVDAQVETCGVSYLPAGVHHGITAIGAAFRWSAWLDAAPAALAEIPPATGRHPVSERQALDYLSEHGLAVIPAVLAQTPEQAVAAAAGFPGPVALKIASADIAHKTEIGGVILGLCGEQAVGDAFRTIIDRAGRCCPTARLDGVIVSPMREGGLELLVGTLRDPQWGPVITVGLGGIWAEALQDTSLRLLPVTEDDVLAMLDELRSARLFDGYRGAPAIDRRAIARAVVRTGEAALALGPDLLSLEINPLLAGPSGAEALDALVVWAGDDEPERT
jgi:acyl-CoA synthetase (NDP forming)